MKLYYNQFNRYFFKFLLLLTSFSVVSCSSEDDQSKAPNGREFVAKADNDARGEYLFRQIYFYEGGEDNIFYEIPVYQSLTRDLSAMDEAVRQQRLIVHSAIIDGIRAQDRNYFTRLAEVVNSGNPQAISDYMLESAKLIETVRTSRGIISKAEDERSAWVIYPVYQTGPVFYPHPLIYTLVLPMPPVRGYIIGGGSNPVHQLVADRVVAILASR